MKHLIAVASLVILAGCTPAPAPVVDLRPEDAKAIRQVEESWNQAWASRDLDKITPFWADDATVMIPNMPVLKGRSAIQAGVKDMLSDPNLSIKFTAGTVEVSKGGDYGYTQGTYTMTMSDPKTKKILTEKGKYLTIFQKQPDGTWKAVEDINNADAPAAQAQ